MKPLDLEPGQYRGTYKLVGGQLSLDLINTISWPGTSREHDWLDPPSNFATWARAVGIADRQAQTWMEEQLPQSAQEGQARLGVVKSARRVLRETIRPLAIGESPPSRAILELNRLLSRACTRRYLDPETLLWQWVTPTTLEQTIAPVIWNAAEVVTSIDPQRIGRCPTCDWLFHDASRNRSRRWCDMDDCGSRDKALRYYHRHKAAR